MTNSSVISVNKTTTAVHVTSNSTPEPNFTDSLQEEPTTEVSQQNTSENITTMTSLSASDAPVHQHDVTTTRDVKLKSDVEITHRDEVNTEVEYTHDVTSAINHVTERNAGVTLNENHDVIVTPHAPGIDGDNVSELDIEDATFPDQDVFAIKV